MTTLPLPQLEKFIPLAVATRRFGIANEHLHRLIGSGAIKAAKLPGGEVVVSEASARQVATYEKINERLRAVTREASTKLHGHAITMSEAIAKYKEACIL